MATDYNEDENITELQIIIDKVFKDKLVDKTLLNKAGFDFLPRYVAEFILGNFVTDSIEVAEGIKQAKDFISDVYPENNSEELLKHQLLEQGEIRILQKFVAHIELKTSNYFVRVPILNEKITIPSYLPSLHPPLLTTGMWGVGHIQYEPESRTKNSLQLSDFKPFQLGAFNQEEWFNARAEFTLEQWIKFIITSLGLNTRNLSQQEMLLIIARLTPICTKNLNLAEFGPKGTGKTYQYRNHSSYTHVVSGAAITPAKFVVDISTNTPGLISTTDVVVFDEITGADFGEKKDFEMIGLLKDYMEGGNVARGRHAIHEDTSIVFIGNIDIVDKKPKYSDFIRELPQAFSEAAFLDRIHGIIPGWLIPKISHAKAAFTSDKGLMSNYLSEALHSLRSWEHPSLVWEKIDKNFLFIRNEKAVQRITKGLLTLLFPGVEITKEELNLLLKIACDLRQNIYNQLHYLDPNEFPKDKLEAFVF